MFQQIKALYERLTRKFETNSERQIRLSGRDTFDYVRGDRRTTGIEKAIAERKDHFRTPTLDPRIYPILR